MDDDVLALENRRNIYQLVSKFPGMYLREIEKELGLSIGVLEYHLNYLVKKDILTVEREGHRKRYFVGEDISYGDKTTIGLLRQETPRRIVVFLMLNPDTSFQDVLAQFSISKSTLSFHMKKLTEGDIVVTEKKGRETYYSVRDVDDTARVILTYKASFLDSVVDRFAEIWDGMGA